MLHGFAFTMIVGIVTGTYSSVFIAAAIAIIWRGAASSAAPAPSRRVRTGHGRRDKAPQADARRRAS